MSSSAPQQEAGPPESLGSPASGRPPVPYIVGVGRSGTTLLRLMLDANSALAIPPETDFAPVLEAFERGGVDAAVKAIVSSRLWGDYNISAEEFVGRVQRQAPTALSEVFRVFFELYAQQRGKPRYGAKTPYHLASMELIHALTPEVRFVHIVRDGRDVALSTIPLWFGPDDVADAARYWAHRVEQGRRQEQLVPFCKEIRYEDLVRDPASVLRGLCEFLELEWEPSMLEYHRQAGQRLSVEVSDVIERGRPVSKAERLGIWRLVDRPPQLSRVERWRREMSAADLATFEAIAGETLEAFGYELSHAP